MSIRLNVIDRQGKETAIDIEEGTTIRDAIVDRLSPAINFLTSTSVN